MNAQRGKAGLDARDVYGRSGEEILQDAMSEMQAEQPSVQFAKSVEERTVSEDVEKRAAEEGYTVRAFHGTQSYFTEFRQDYSGATWFSDVQAVAGNYSGKNENSHIMNVFLKMRNPL